MNDPKDSLPPRWHDLVATARHDQPPALDPHALVRTLRTETSLRAVEPSPEWWPAFASLFGSRTVLAGVTVATLALCAVVAWQTTQVWQDVMPWAELIAGEDTLLIGGVL